MTNIEKLNAEGRLTEFVLDYAKARTEDEWYNFASKYKIKHGMPVTKWLMADVEETKPTVAPGVRVKRTYMRLIDDSLIVVYGTVTQVIVDSKGEHVLVEWDDIESFKTMEVIGQDSVEVVEE